MSRGPSAKMRADMARAGAFVRWRRQYAERVADPVRISAVRSEGALMLKAVDPDTRALIDAFQQQKKGDAK